MRPKPRLALQLGIIGAALWLMAGCFYLPAKHKTVDGSPLPDDTIGPPDSRKPLLLHRSTADDVRRVFGRNLAFSPDGRYALYTYVVRTGYIVWPLCFYAGPDTKSNYLQLRFGPDGRLTGFDVFDDWQQATHDTGIPRPYFGWSPATRPTTPLTPEQEQRVRQRLVARRQSETRPTTVPAHVR